MSTMYLPYLASLKRHYSGIYLEPSGGNEVAVSIKNPQKGFKDLAYPGIGLEYVTGTLNRNRIGSDRRLSASSADGLTKIVRKALEPMDFLMYVHTFVQDSQSMDDVLQGKMIEKTPFYFAVDLELADGTYNCEIYREGIDPVVIEGMDREIHNVYSLHVWGWVDPDPVGTTTKLVTQYPELRTVIGLDLSELPIPPI